MNNITYDKQMLKRIHKEIKAGKKKSVLKSSIYFSLLFFVFMIIIMGAIEWKTEENFTLSFGFVLKWLLLAIFNFFYIIILDLNNGIKLKPCMTRP